MEQINWRISPAATFAKFLFNTEANSVVLPPEWQAVLPQVLSNANDLGITQEDLSSSHRFVDALEPLVSSNRLPELFAGVAQPVLEQINNEVSLRTSQLKHHWLIRGPGLLGLLEDYCPLFNLVLIDMWTTIPLQSTAGLPTHMLLGEKYSAAVFAASLHDTNPFIPEVMRPAYIATFFALQAQLSRNLNFETVHARLSLASCRLALSLGNAVELNAVDEPSFQTAVDLWAGLPGCSLTESLWAASGEMIQLEELTAFCLDWISQPDTGEVS